MDRETSILLVSLTPHEIRCRTGYKDIVDPLSSALGQAALAAYSRHRLHILLGSKNSFCTLSSCAVIAPKDGLSTEKNTPSTRVQSYGQAHTSSFVVSTLACTTHEISVANVCLVPRRSTASEKLLECVLFYALCCYT